MGKNLKGKELGRGITQRKDGKYSAKFSNTNGKRVEKYFDKLSEARKWLEEAKYEDAHGNIGKSTNMTVNAWFEYWISEIKGKTVRRGTRNIYITRYNKNIKEIIGSMLISEVKPMHCQNILNIMDNQGYASGSIERTKATMSVMFSDAKENDIIISNPITKSVKCPKKEKKIPRVLTIKEQEKFLETAKKSCNYLQYLFVLQTGLRTGELTGLRWEDIDFQKRLIHIRRSMRYDSSINEFIIDEPKSKSGYRDIPMTQMAYDVLMEVKKKKIKQTICLMQNRDLIFLNRNGNPTTNADYDLSLLNICKKAGIERISMHTLRHTFATRCIESGMKPKTLQMILGHSQISMTMDLYVHVTEEEKEKEMKKFEELYKMA